MERIRPKIFYTDLFREEFLGFTVPLNYNTPDWSVEGSMVVSIADQAFSQLSSAMTEYLQMVPGIITEDDPSLGLLHNEQRHSLNYSWRE